MEVLRLIERDGVARMLQRQRGIAKKEMVKSDGAMAAQPPGAQIVHFGDFKDSLSDLDRLPAGPGLVPICGQAVKR